MSKKNVSKAKETPKGVSHRMPKSGESVIGTLSEREKLASRVPIKERIRPIKDYENLYAASTSDTDPRQLALWALLRSVPSECTTSDTQRKRERTP